MIEALVPLLASWRMLEPLDPASPSGFGSALQQLASEFNAAAAQLLATIDNAIIDLTRAAYITVLLVGVFLYFTRIQKRLGRDLIVGGIVLALLVEFVFPAISSL
jgi:hypothetical protein